MGFNDKNNKEDLKYELGNHAKISKYKIIFAEGCVPIGMNKFF